MTVTAKAQCSPWQESSLYSLSCFFIQFAGQLGRYPRSGFIPALLLEPPQAERL